MESFALLENLAAKRNGVLTTADAQAANVSKFMLEKFVRQKEYTRVYHGIYLAPDAWRDEAYLTQLRCPQIIYSHDCALFYHDLTDREPTQLTATAKTGYNPTHLAESGVKIYTVKKSLYEVGLSDTLTPFGNTVKAYDMERTICDIVRSKRTIEAQTFQDALRQYVRRKDKNLLRLMEYAKLFHVEKLIREYMGVLL